MGKGGAQRDHATYGSEELPVRAGGRLLDVDVRAERATHHRSTVSEVALYGLRQHCALTT
ncbi:hypothetical protein Ssi02_27660 [Sinosporangium siamense]|uniref:Uncharacterized protein n=1 Tax=Sinosporangium siamense TaxID=1367973 RepID=A0A919V525_9ACTN|nr:hypothetical protein Ssi02_27660 [Sinosporangium siamense]